MHCNLYATLQNYLRLRAQEISIVSFYSVNSFFSFSCGYFVCDFCSLSLYLFLLSKFFNSWTRRWYGFRVFASVNAWWRKHSSSSSECNKQCCTFKSSSGRWHPKLRPVSGLISNFVVVRVIWIISGLGNVSVWLVLVMNSILFTWFRKRPSNLPASIVLQKLCLQVVVF